MKVKEPMSKIVPKDIKTALLNVPLVKLRNATKLTFSITSIRYKF